MFFASFKFNFYWLVLAIIIISLFNFVYSRTMKPLLLRIGVRGNFVLPFMESIWQLSFFIIALPMTYICLEESLLDDWVLTLDKQLTACKLHEEECFSRVQGMKSVFILITAFLLDDIIATFLSKGFKNFDFYQKQVFFAIFALTCYSKCAKFGLCLFFLSNCVKAAELASKISFLVAKRTSSNVLHVVTIVLAAVSVKMWLSTFLYVYPVFLSNNKSVNSAMMKAELNMLIVMDFLTWVYLAVTVANSMFTRMVLSVAVQSDLRPKCLAYFLLGCDPWIKWLTNTASHTVKGVEDVIQSPAQRQLRTLRALITCRKLLMRRVGRLREGKLRRGVNGENKEGESSTTSTSAGPSTATRQATTLNSTGSDQPTEAHALTNH